MNNLIQTLLFRLNPEQAHAFTLTVLNCLYRLKLSRFFFKSFSAPRTIMNLHFNNPIGIAAGLDKNGDYVDALSQLPIGFIEIGTVTPKPQPGNPKPRLFRLEKEKAIVNRMGFNNKGVDYVARRLSKTNYRGILGINLGINKTTPIENAIDDYLYGMRVLWRYASYFTINISSPNTAHLRDLQQKKYLDELLILLKQEQQSILDNHQKYIPFVIKISPDLSETELKIMAELFLKHKIDGVIATNTTALPNGQGGLSGAPLTARSTEVIKTLHMLLKNTIPIIASGGVMSAKIIQEKFDAGASLVQVYTGLVYDYSTVTDFAKLRG